MSALLRKGARQVTGHRAARGLEDTSDNKAERGETRLMLRHALFEFLGTRFRALGGCCMLAKVNQRLARLGEIRRVTTRLYQRRGGEGECVGCEDVVGDEVEKVRNERT